MVLLLYLSNLKTVVGLHHTDNEIFVTQNTNKRPLSLAIHVHICNNRYMSDSTGEATTFQELFQARGAHYTYRKGEFIIRPGEIPSGIFYIESGLVKAYDITKYGEENMLIIRRKDEIFPLIWAITGQERSVIYESLVPTTVRLIRREVFTEFIERNPEALKALLDMSLEMYRVHSERILSLGYRNVRERLVSYLVSLASRFGEITAEGYTLLNVPLRHQDIGSSISASRESVGREIQALEKRGLVKMVDGYMVLCDIDSLHDFL
jgi:CRP-like cAMP-binding protein